MELSGTEEMEVSDSEKIDCTSNPPRSREMLSNWLSRFHLTVASWNTLI